MIEFSIIKTTMECLESESPQVYRSTFHMSPVPKTKIS